MPPPDPLEAVRTAMRAYAGADTPPARVCAAMLDLCQELKATQDTLAAKLGTTDLAKQFLIEMQKASREIAPNAARVQRWQRAGAAIQTAVVVLCALLMVGLAVWHWTSAPQCAGQIFAYPNGGAACWIKLPEIQAK